MRGYKKYDEELKKEAVILVNQSEKSMTAVALD